MSSECQFIKLTTENVPRKATQF